MKMILTWMAMGLVACTTGCRPLNRTARQADARPLWTMVPTNVSPEAWAVLGDLTGCFLASEPFLPPKATVALPSRTYETVQFDAHALSASTYTVFIDHTNRQFWVLRTDGAPAMSEFYGPSGIGDN
jgi:hypothetical protein